MFRTPTFAHYSHWNHCGLSLTGLGWGGPERYSQQTVDVLLHLNSLIPATIPSYRLDYRPRYRAKLLRWLSGIAAHSTTFGATPRRRRSARPTIAVVVGGGSRKNVSLRMFLNRRNQRRSIAKIRGLAQTSNIFIFVSG